MKPVKMLADTNHIRQQAQSIRDIAQRVIDACENGTPIEAYSRNKIAGGSLAQDAAVLAIMIIQYEAEED